VDRWNIAATSEIMAFACSTIGFGPHEIDIPSPSLRRVSREGRVHRLSTERDPTLDAEIKRVVQ